LPGRRTDASTPVRQASDAGPEAGGPPLFRRGHRADGRGLQHGGEVRRAWGRQHEQRRRKRRRREDGEDIIAASEATAALLSRGKGGPWENPQTGVRGTITPIAAAYRDNGAECRDFLASYVHDKAEAWMQGEACHTGAGRWEVRSLKPWRR
jgi:hypothetical protein